MKKLPVIGRIVLLVMVLLSPIQTLACGGFELFTAQNSMTHSTDETRVFVSYKEGEETFIVQPDFSGTAKQFGVVLPFPARPDITAAPNTFFDELSTLVKPSQLMVFGALKGAESISKVTVVAQKNIGDFETTTVTATSSKDLIQWLRDHQFSYSEADVSNFDYYVNKGSYYFVALKVNASVVKTDNKGMILGSLKPLAFTFATEKPVVAMRISASTMKPMNYELYTASQDMLFVPGTAIDYSARVQKEDITAGVKGYLSSSDWLTHAVVTMDPKTIDTDLELTQAQVPEVVSKKAIVLNPEDVPSKAGIVLATSTALRKDISVIQPTPTPTLIQNIRSPEPSSSPAPAHTNTALVFWTIILVGFGVEAVAAVLLFMFLRKKNV